MKKPFAKRARKSKKSPSTQADQPESIKDKIIVGIIVGIVVSIVLALFTAYVIPSIDTAFNSRPSDPALEERAIALIIEQEAASVQAHNVSGALALYADNAVVKDAARGNASLEVTWMGKASIAERYQALPNFTFIRHDDIHVTIEQANIASATADTFAQYTDNSGATVSITSNQGEKWAFEKINDEWKITGFTYNLH